MIHGKVDNFFSYSIAYRCGHIILDIYIISSMCFKAFGDLYFNYRDVHYRGCMKMKCYILQVLAIIYKYRVPSYYHFRLTLCLLSSFNTKEKIHLNIVKSIFIFSCYFILHKLLLKKN